MGSISGNHHFIENNPFVSFPALNIHKFFVPKACQTRSVLLASGKESLLKSCDEQLGFSKPGKPWRLLLGVYQWVMSSAQEFRRSEIK